MGNRVVNGVVIEMTPQEEAAEAAEAQARVAVMAELRAKLDAERPASLAERVAELETALAALPSRAMK